MLGQRLSRRTSNKPALVFAWDRYHQTMDRHKVTLIALEYFYINQESFFLFEIIIYVLVNLPLSASFKYLCYGSTDITHVLVFQCEDWIQTESIESDYVVYSRSPHWKGQTLWGLTSIRVLTRRELFKHVALEAGKRCQSMMASLDVQMLVDDLSLRAVDGHWNISTSLTMLILCNNPAKKPRQTEPRNHNPAKIIPSKQKTLNQWCFNVGSTFDPNGSLMLAQRRRQWTSIKPTFG